MATGSLQLKGKIYQAIVYYESPDGSRKRVSRSTYQSSKRAAKLVLDQLKIEFSEKEAINTGSAFMSDFMLDWLGIKRASLRPNTYTDYCKSVHKHIIPWFAQRNLRVAEVKAFHIEALKNQLLKTVSSDTTRTLIGYVSAALRNTL